MKRKPLPKNQKKKGATKRQHYVPRLILRRFSDDGATTGLIVLKDARRIDRAPLKQQCYGDYFYGADQVMENSFQAEEAKVGAYLGNLSESHVQSLPARALHDLKLFVHYQFLRTQGAAQSSSNLLAQHVRSAVRSTAWLNGDRDVLEGLDSIDIRFKNMQRETLWLATKSTPLMMDLRVKFIFGTGFVIGDHPVAQYNQFAQQHPLFSRWPTTTGLALKGLQLFMPLSPLVTLAVYDPAVYEYGSDDSVFVKASDEDVVSLNKMQAINALECLYFDRRYAGNGLDALTKARADHPSLYIKPISTSSFIAEPDNSLSEYVVVTHPDIRIGASLSFLKVTDDSRYDGYDGGTIPVRSQDLLRFTELYGQHLEQELEARRVARQATKPAP